MWRRTGLELYVYVACTFNSHCGRGRVEKSKKFFFRAYKRVDLLIDGHQILLLFWALQRDSGKSSGSLPTRRTLRSKDVYSPKRALLRCWLIRPYSFQQSLHLLPIGTTLSACADGLCNFNHWLPVVALSHMYGAEDSFQWHSPCPASLQRHANAIVGKCHCW